MLRCFNPEMKGRGFFKRTTKEILTQKLSLKSRTIKRSTYRVKKIDQLKRTTEESLVRKSEKMKKLKSELDSLK